jgi:hypothetical protein
MQLGQVLLIFVVSLQEDIFNTLANYLLSLSLIFGCAPRFSRGIVQGHWDISMCSNFSKLPYAASSNYNKDTRKHVLTKNKTTNTKEIMSNVYLFFSYVFLT